MLWQTRIGAAVLCGASNVPCTLVWSVSRGCGDRTGGSECRIADGVCRAQMGTANQGRHRRQISVYVRMSPSSFHRDSFCICGTHLREVVCAIEDVSNNDAGFRRCRLRSNRSGSGDDLLQSSHKFKTTHILLGSHGRGALHLVLNIRDPIGLFRANDHNLGLGNLSAGAWAAAAAAAGAAEDDQTAVDARLAELLFKCNEDADNMCWLVTTHLAGKAADVLAAT